MCRAVGVGGVGVRDSKSPQVPRSLIASLISGSFWPLTPAGWPDKGEARIECRRVCLYRWGGLPVCVCVTGDHACLWCLQVQKCVFYQVCACWKKSAFSVSVCEPLTACDLLVSSAAIMVIKSFVISRFPLMAVKSLWEGGPQSVCKVHCLQSLELRKGKITRGSGCQSSELSRRQTSSSLSSPPPPRPSWKERISWTWWTRDLGLPFAPCDGGYLFLW